MSFDDSDFISFNDILGDSEPAAAATTASAKHSAAAFSKSERRTSQKRNATEAGLDKEEEAILKSVSRSTPWTTNVAWADAETAEKQLHAEILAFVDYITPTQPEHALRIAVIESVRRAIGDRWDDAVVEPFGSFQTELYLPSGDIDLVVLCPSMGPAPGRMKSSLFAIAALLRARGLATDIVVIHKARVPIIKFKSTYGKFAIDISINRPGGPSAGRVVKKLLAEVGEVAAKSLIMVVKAFLLQRGLNEVFSGGLGSYSIICMVVSFLQLHPKIQTQEINPNHNLGVLLVEFFELYGRNFNFDAVGVTVRPPGGYFSKVARGWQRPNQPYLLSIEDPQDTTNDISGGSHNILTVRQSISGAFDLLSAALCQRKALLDASATSRERHASTSAHLDPCKQSLLAAIIGMHPEVTSARNKNAELALSGLVQQDLGLTMPPVVERRSFSQRATSPTGSGEMDISDNDSVPAETPLASTSTATSVAPEETQIKQESEVRRGKRKAVAVVAAEDGEADTKPPKKKKSKRAKAAEANGTASQPAAIVVPPVMSGKVQRRAEKMAARLDKEVKAGSKASTVWAQAEDEAAGIKRGIQIFGLAQKLAQSSPASKAKAITQPKAKIPKKKFDSTAQFLPLSEDEADLAEGSPEGSEDDSRYSLRRKKSLKPTPTSAPPTPAPKAKKPKKSKKQPKADDSSLEGASNQPLFTIDTKPSKLPKTNGKHLDIPKIITAKAIDADFEFVDESESDNSSAADLQIHAEASKPSAKSLAKQQYWANKRESATAAAVPTIDYDESPALPEPGSD